MQIGLGQSAPKYPSGLLLLRVLEDPTGLPARSAAPTRRSRFGQDSRGPTFNGTKFRDGSLFLAFIRALERPQEGSPGSLLES